MEDCGYDYVRVQVVLRLGQRTGLLLRSDNFATTERCQNT